MIAKQQQNTVSVANKNPVNNSAIKQMIAERISLPAPYLNKDFYALCDAFLSLNTRDEMTAFLRDICTEQEISEMGNRLCVATLLSQDNNYLKISKETGMSSSTIARVNQWLRGGLGGYRMAIKRTAKTIKRKTSRDPHHSHSKPFAKEDCADV